MRLSVGSRRRGAGDEKADKAMAKQIQTKQGAVKIDGVYSDESAARSAASRWNLWLVLGDEDQFWTVKPRDAARLERAGYSIATV
jgi:hypothetical protein